MIAIFARVNMPEQEKRASAFRKVHLFYVIVYPCRAKTCFVSLALLLQTREYACTLVCFIFRFNLIQEGFYLVLS